MIVTPFEVKSESKTASLDYGKLIEKFGSQPIEKELLDRFEKVTGQKPHHFLTRGVFFSHRELEKILDAHEKGEKFYLYTGRGPSSQNMHLGHLVPFMFCKYLQDVFKVPIVIQITDDEKLFFKEKLNHDKIQEMARENIKDIIACGFDPSLTFIFKNTDYIGQMYPMIMQIQKRLNLRQVIGVFGFDLDNVSIGKLAFPSIQMAPSFAKTFESLFETTMPLKKVRCLIPCAIDQDPYFRISRDMASKLGCPKPALIHSKFIPSLKGVGEKMSASDSDSLIYLTDSKKQITKKINKSFSGGKDTLEEHREKGGDTSIDIPFQLLTFFLEDESILSEYKNGYESGNLLTSDMKKLCIETIQTIVEKFQENRKKITDEVYNSFTLPSPIKL